MDCPEWHVLEEAVAFFASECARKLREQGTCCGQVTVFAYTSRFRTDVPGNMIQQRVTYARTDTGIRPKSCMRLWKRCGCMRMTGGFDYKKSGVIVWDLSPREAVQTDLFDKMDRGKRGALIRAVDEDKPKNGHNVVKVAALGLNRNMLRRGNTLRDVIQRIWMRSW